MTTTPPVARREPFTFEQLGRTRVDDYAWMRDENYQDVMRDPSLLRADIREHLESENAYMRGMLHSTKALQETIFQEMRGRTKEDDSSVPKPDGDWEYYSRFETGQQYPIYARRPRGRNDGEQILINVNDLAAGKAFYKIAQAEHAPDHSLFAYSADEQGSEIHTIYVKDLATGQVLASPITDGYGDFVWSPDSQFIFWTYRDENGRPARIMRRPARGAEDVVVYEEADEGMFLSPDVTESEAFILISSGNQEMTEVRYIPAATPTAAPTLFHPRAAGVIYTPTHWNDRWHVLTNADGAIDFKVMTCAEGATGKANWREFIAHEPGRYIMMLTAYENHLVRHERVNALPRIAVRDRAGGEHEVAFDEAAYWVEPVFGFEYATATTRFYYESPTTPVQWFDYDMATRTRILRKTQEVPSGHDPSHYQVRRFFAPATDGKQVPVTVLMKRDTPLDGSAPLLLYGYGAYGWATEADFSIRRLSLVDRGWIYAIAHVRGGTEMGYGWFLDGRKRAKRNSFTDFIAVAEELVRQNYSRAGAMVCQGGSAGGLLVGGGVNMRPDLWAGVIAEVPFMDVITTMSDASLPLTPPEWPEWGNPIENADDYDYMISYSPYDNIEAKAYPAILATAGLTDPRVTYWEPAKWVAKLRTHTTSTRPILLKTNMTAGHAGAAGRFDSLKEEALNFAFALKAIGASEAGGAF
ncbi:protease II [alpha proteobacterium U9-1i]|nr:protease II [alpha proteobacterium U9-1i]